MEPLRIALRYLLARRSQNAISVISLISVIGVGVATMAIVCVLSVFNGFRQLAESQSDTLNPDLLVTASEGKVIDKADSVVGLLANNSAIVAVAPVLEERALIKSGVYQMPVRVRGVTDSYSEITLIDSAVMSDGAFVLNDSVLGPMATLSVGVAIDLRQRPGADSEVELYVPRRRGRINPANPAAAFRTQTLTVGGVFQVDDVETDADLVLVPYDVAARLLDREDAATSIGLKLAADVNGDAVARQLSDELGDKFHVATRRQQNQTSLRMIAIEKWITFAMMAFILIIASFNIISTLSMMVIEKTENIQTLFALGADRKFVSSIFRCEGWLISLAGGVGGIVVGLLLSLAQQHFGFIKLGGDHDVMVTDVYPVHVEATDLLAVFVLAALVGWVTSSVAAAFSRRRLSLSRDSVM